MTHTHSKGFLTYITLILASLLLSACSRVHHDIPRSPSTHLPISDNTELDMKVAPLLQAHQQPVSGFYVLTDGIDAAAARLRLAEQAKRSIDIQYYLLKRDQFGDAFLSSLLAAADRGVRIRLLLDDMFNKGFDQGMLALNSHPYIEIRIYNPFNRGLFGRSLGALTRFKRINRRMHNKSFTVDNRITVIGGRNIADEYFGVGKDSAFGDLDVVSIGPIVDDVSNMFDQYWNHENVVPLAGFLKAESLPEPALTHYRAKLIESDLKLASTRYAQAVIDRAYEGVENKIEKIRWSPYTFIYDTPDKGIKGRAAEDELIMAALIKSLSQLERELWIVSPYFVPNKDLMKGLLAARENGITIHIVTNSLAANNQALVHGGYAPSRKPLLKAGVHIYEIRPDAHVPGTEYVDISAARSTLHTKSYVLDEREVFIGSFNFDPRSAFLNTEMGVLINDPSLGQDFVTGLQRALPWSAWKLMLDENGNIEWHGNEQGETVIYTKEPMTNWWQRTMAGFFRFLPIRSQL